MRHVARRLGAALALTAGLSGGARAEPTYPFVGAWVRADRVCSATSTRERIYTPRDVVSSRGRCQVRRIAAGPDQTFELFEKCARPNEKTSRVSETIRMSGPDSMTLTRQITRLKLSRSIKFNRCPLGARSAR